MHKHQGAVSNKYPLSRNVLGALKKTFKTGQAFRWPVSRGKFNSQPFKESHEKMSTLLNIRDMQIKTTMRYFLTRFTVTIVQKLTINAGESVEKGNSPILLVKRLQPLRRTGCRVFKKWS